MSNSSIGADGINSASVQRGDTIVVTAGSKVHLNCRKRYTNPIEIKTQQSKTKRPSIPLKRSSRASVAPFNSKTDCLFCGITIVPGSSDYNCVKTDAFANTIMECCDSRFDNWSLAMKVALNTIVVIYMLQTACITIHVVGISGLDLIYPSSYGMVLKESVRKLDDPEIKIRSKHFRKCVISLKVMMKKNLLFQINNK